MNLHHESDSNPDPLDRFQAPDPILANLDQILSREAPILPTSGFALSVMDSIRAEASQPAPKFSSTINFPWARLLPGTIIALAILAWYLWKLSASLFTALHSTSQQLQPTTFQLTAPVITAGWLLLALASSLLPLLLIRRIMGRSALL